MAAQPAKVLTVAGSDSGGAAGLQADLKTWTVLQVYGMSAVTAVTAQNSVAVRGVEFMSPAFVAAQIAAVLSDYGAAAVKTGFLGRAEIAEAIARELAKAQVPFTLIDPVLVNHRGEQMFGDALTKAYRSALLPLADLVTPNWREAALLAGLPPEVWAEADAAARCAERLHAAGAANVLITGRRVGNEVVDWFTDGHRLEPLTAAWLETPNRHGSGDTLSAAICAFAAQGMTLVEAVQAARQFTRKAIEQARDWQMGTGHGPLAHLL